MNKDYQFNLYIENLIKNSVYDNINKYSKIKIIITGGGISAYYSTGVYAYLKHLSQIYNIEIVATSSVSSGAHSCSFIMNKDTDYMTWLNTYYDLQESHKKGKYVVESAVSCLNKLVPDNIHELCNDKMFITTTKLTLFGPKWTIHSKYKNKEDFIKKIIASSSIPYITTKYSYAKIDNEIHVDGLLPYNFTNKEHQDGIPILYINLFALNYPILHMINPKDRCIEELMIRGVRDMHLLLTKNKQMRSLYWYDNNGSHKKIFLISLILKLTGILISLIVLYKYTYGLKYIMSGVNFIKNMISYLIKLFYQIYGNI